MNAEIDEDETMSETKTPPYIPPSILEKRVKWDVFLSFRGEDTRAQFTTHLRDGLKSKGLTPFMDDEGMERGDTIQPSLDEAIIDSALAIAILSPNYADSHWCVEELFRIFECKKRVIPVFYGVVPSDVRNQSGGFGNGFKKLLDDQRFSSEVIERWRNALKNVGIISGFERPIERKQEKLSSSEFNTDEVNVVDEELIQRIVQNVRSELKDTTAVKLEVGVDVRVDKVVGILDIGHHDVRFLNIHGASGIGKTTLARAVYNRLTKDFKKRCFISNVGERLAHEEGILSVQNELIKGLSSENVQSADDGIAAIKRIVSQNRVLLVLDDVFEAQQLDDLGIIKEWFHKGSRMIVTSRNKDALLGLPCSYELYEVEKLNASESLELFSIHALGRRKPKPEFQYISDKVVSLMGGLPLALEVFGSSLVKKTKRGWGDALTKLQCIAPSSQKLQQILRISYDGLEDREKTVFLDISCLLLLIDKKREDIVDILAGCGLTAELAIGNLVMKSLLKITERNKLWMHDQIRDMGRQIVIEECSTDIGKRSRLWDSSETIRFLREEKVTEVVRGIVLNIKKPPEFTEETVHWFNLRRLFSISNLKGLTSPQVSDENGNVALHTKWFEKMKNLKLLRMDYAKLQGDFKHMPCELRWLQWKGCTEKALPTNIPEGLRVLDLSGSNIEHLWSSDRSWWGSSKVAGNLEVINLSNCRKLSALPDMSGHKHLKKVNLEQCEQLAKIHESIGNMSSLVYLNLRGCKNLAEFPRDVTGMKGLKELILSGCSKISKLPEDVRSMKSLNRLFLDGTSITKLPDTIHHLTQLEVLNLSSCHQLTPLPDCLTTLTNLEILN